MNESYVVPNKGGWCAAEGGRCYVRSTVEANLRMGFAVAWVVGEAPRALPLGLADFLRLGVTTRSRPHPADGPDLFCGASSTMHVAATPTGNTCCAQTALLTSKVLGEQTSGLSKLIGMEREVRTRTDPNPTKHWQYCIAAFTGGQYPFAPQSVN